MSEADLERAVRDLLKLFGLYGYHTRDSRGCEPGFPDWVIVGLGRRVLWRELKSATGVLTPDQRRVRDLLVGAGQDWAVWRPVDLENGRIVRELKAAAGTGQSLSTGG